ncbi:hypothetical protein L484_007984 [Morus notabilis]|uniref:Uncharacterized protein n=1 Tax=Morus notabilis TaxID=981085 RepID=W9QXG2_9ROSA|nr:hypothetical protein L484_007984 [Morus notabilis]
MEEKDLAKKDQADEAKKRNRRSSKRKLRCPGRSTLVKLIEGFVKEKKVGAKKLLRIALPPRSLERDARKLNAETRVPRVSKQISKGHLFKVPRVLKQGSPLYGSQYGSKGHLFKVPSVEARVTSLRFLEC